MKALHFFPGAVDTAATPNAAEAAALTISCARVGVDIECGRLDAIRRGK